MGVVGNSIPGTLDVTPSARADDWGRWYRWRPGARAPHGAKARPRTGFPPFERPLVCKHQRSLV